MRRAAQYTSCFIKPSFILQRCPIVSSFPPRFPVNPSAASHRLPRSLAGYSVGVHYGFRDVLDWHPGHMATPSPLLQLYDNTNGFLLHVSMNKIATCAGLLSNPRNAHPHNRRRCSLQCPVPGCPGPRPPYQSRLVGQWKYVNLWAF